jgi:protease stability complex PrcB-like protein
MRPRVTPRALSLLALFAAAACGSGRLVPVDTAQPSGAGAPSEPAAAQPAPGTATEGAPVTPNAPADPNASGYVPPATDTTGGTPGQSPAPGAAPQDSTMPAPVTDTGSAAAAPAYAAPANPAPAPAPAPTSAPGVAPAPSGAAPAAAPSTRAAAPAPAPQPAPAALAIRRVGQWSTSNVTAPARLIIRDDSAYAQFWASLGPAAGARPSVDFTRDIVIAVAAGQQSTGGHSIAVQRVTRVGDGLAVQVLETTPAPGCNVSQGLTQPVDIVVVDGASARTWSFSESTQARPC